MRINWKIIGINVHTIPRVLWIVLFVSYYRIQLCRHLRFSFRLLVFHAFLCWHRQVDRFKVSCFSMSTGFALFYDDRFKVSIFALFPVYMSTGLCMYIQSWCRLAKRYSILITHFTRIIDRAWTLRIYKYVIISGRYIARKQWKLYIINMKMATCPVSLHYWNFNPALDSFDTY